MTTGPAEVFDLGYRGYEGYRTNSPRLEKNIGYAMLPIELTEFGTELEVEAPTGRQSAVVVRKPFIDPKKDTPKQEVAIGAVGETSHVD
jgi:glycine cleavage system aminomethyltransferase T